MRGSSSSEEKSSDNTKEAHTRLKLRLEKKQKQNFHPKRSILYKHFIPPGSYLHLENLWIVQVQEFRIFLLTL